MNRDIAILRETIKKLTPMLAGKGLKVTQQGTRAYVRTNAITLEPISVNIPYLPDNASDELIIAIQGFIDHEVAHVLFTDWADIRESVARGEMVAMFTNALEDPFIERKIGEKYPGSRLNVANLHRFFVDRITTPALEKVKTDMDRLSILFVPFVRAKYGQKTFDDFMRDEGHYDDPIVKAMVAKIGDEILNQIPTINCTADSLRIAQEIYDALTKDQDSQQCSGGQGKGEKPHKSDSQDADGDEQSEGEKEDSQAGDDQSKQGQSDGAGEESSSDDDKEQKSSKKSRKNKSSDEEESGEDDASAGSDDEENEGDKDQASGSGKGDKEEDEGNDENDADDGDADGSDGDDEEEEDADGDDKADDDEEGDKEEDGADDSTGDDEVDNQEDDEGDLDEGDEEEDADGDGTDEEEGEDDADAGDDDSDDAGDDDSDETDGTSGIPEGDLEKDEIHEEVSGTMQETYDGISMSEMKVDFADFDGSIATEIQKAAIDSAMTADYLPYTTDFDVTEVHNVSGRYEDKWLTQLEDDTRFMVGVMQKDIERMMAARSRAVNVPGFRTGRLHSAGLHRLASGDPRVFRRKEVHQTKDTAVMLLIDNSGSMAGAKMKTAMTAGFALCQTLERVGFSSEVIGFTSGSYWSKIPVDPSEIQEEQDKMGRPFNRVDILEHHIYKDHNERLTPTVKKRFADALNNQNFLHANFDGESVQMAAWRLLSRKEARKVMIVLSDGAPCGVDAEPYLKQTVDKCSRMGIDMIGIGIQAKDVRHYYPRNFVINNPSELPAAVMGELKRIILS